MAIITISAGGTFFGRKDLAKALANKLGYRYLERKELLESTAKKWDWGADNLNAAVDKDSNWLKDTKLGKIRYMAYVRSALCLEAKNDNMVYSGIGGHILLPSGIGHVLRVRLVADMEFRIKLAMERLNVGREKAMEVIREMSQDRANWLISMYQVDWQDTSLCDLVLNLEQIDMDYACDLLSHVAQGPRFKTTAESQRIMNDAVLASEIRARIAAYGRHGEGERIMDYDVRVGANNGAVTIGGKARSEDEINRIFKVARETPGVSQVNFEMRLQPSGPIYERGKVGADT